MIDLNGKGCVNEIVVDFHNATPIHRKVEYCVKLAATTRTSVKLVHNNISISVHQHSTVQGALRDYTAQVYQHATMMKETIADVDLLCKGRVDLFGELKWQND